MSNKFYGYIFILIPMFSFGQSINFEQITPSISHYVEMDGVFMGSIAFCDIDSDNDEDLMVTGNHGGYDPVSRIYFNDGLGNFTIGSNLPFNGVLLSSVAFADIDGDLDQDLLITGRKTGLIAISELYLNDGNGIFSLSQGTSFEGVWRSSVAFSDIDGDLDMDLLITGLNQSNEAISNLYKNDGLGNFNLVVTSTIHSIYNGSIAFSDIDLDNDQDLILSGSNEYDNAISSLYINDGIGNFNIVTSPFEGVKKSSVAIADVDNDNYPDILITGLNNSNIKTNILYKNDGLGVFSIYSTDFEGIDSGSILFSDVDSDNDQDLFIVGANNSNEAISNLYINDGNGNFTVSLNDNIGDVSFSSIGAKDFDGDDDIDLFITGQSNFGVNVSLIYFNDGFGNYSQGVNSPFEGVYEGSLAFADIDADSDLDLLITGVDIFGAYSTKLYSNDGLGNYTIVPNTNFEQIAFSSIAFSDIDNDTDQDVLLSGQNTEFEEISKLYINDGMGNFTLSNNTSFEGVYRGSVAFGDMDGDNDKDLLLTGINSFGTNVSRMYFNDGIEDFNISNISPEPIVNAGNSSVAFSEVNGDGIQDFMILGYYPSLTRVTKLYMSIGGGNFITPTPNPFTPVNNGALAFGDIDSDNVQDLLITGATSVSELTRLYKNDGNGNFSVVNNTSFINVEGGSATIADFDGDLKNEIFISGYSSTFSKGLSRMYQSDLNENFNVIDNLPFDSLFVYSVAYGDIDGDEDLDLIISGLVLNKVPVTRLYRNLKNSHIVGNENLFSNNYVWDVYPNPSVDFIKISSKKEGLLVLLSEQNQIVWEKRKEKENLTMDISNLASGVYVLKFVTSDGVDVKKIIKI